MSIKFEKARAIITNSIFYLCCLWGAFCVHYAFAGCLLFYFLILLYNNKRPFIVGRNPLYEYRPRREAHTAATFVTCIVGPAVLGGLLFSEITIIEFLSKKLGIELEISLLIFQSVASVIIPVGVGFYCYYLSFKLFYHMFSKSFYSDLINKEDNVQLP